MKARVITSERILVEVREILRTSKLPYQDLRLDNNHFVSYHDDNGNMIGCGGLEFYSDVALLRSIAVTPSLRGKSIGKEIVNDLMRRAKETGKKEVYLLTETAHDYFLKHGFSDISRDHVPFEIQESSEFSSVCPVSASVMVCKIV